MIIENLNLHTCRTNDKDKTQLGRAGKDRRAPGDNNHKFTQEGKL